MRVKEFKDKSEKLKNMVEGGASSDKSEAISEELRKDEKKLGVSSTAFGTNCIIIEHHQEVRKGAICGFPLALEFGGGSPNREEDEEQAGHRPLDVDAGEE